MNRSRVAGGPLGVARVDLPDRSRSPGRRPLRAAVALALRVLAGAAIVEAVAISSFGLVAGTAIALLAATVMAIAYQV
jgi:hypothetical protein